MFPIPPTKYGGTFFISSFASGKINFLGHIFKGMFYMGTNHQIMQGGSYWLRGFKSLVKLVFPLIDLSLGY